MGSLCSATTTYASTSQLRCTFSSNFQSKKAPKFPWALLKAGAINGARTHDNRNHNPGLYQLSYDRRMHVL